MADSEAASSPLKAFPRFELLLFVVAGTALHWASLIHQLPLAQRLQGWFWPYSEIPLWHLWLIPLLAVAGLLVGAYTQRGPLGGACTQRNPGRTARGLAAVVAFCFSLQLGVAWLEGSYGRALEESLTQSGHWRMAEVASTSPGAWRVASDFEALLAEIPEPGFLKSKPPGHLLFYMLTLEAVSIVDPPATAEARLERFASSVAYVWALVCALALIPIFFVARLFLSEAHAFRVCLAYSVVPAVQLITGHLDLVLFPLLAASCAWLAGAACARFRRVLAVAAGALTAISLFISFSLIAALPLLVAVAAGCLWKRGDTGPTEWARLAASFAAGALVVQATLAFGLGYDAVARFEEAFRVHSVWQRHPFTPRVMVYSAILNGVELIYWWGVPLIAGWTVALTGACARAALRRPEAADFLALGTGLVMLLLCVFGNTMAEVARIWAFLIPFACLLAVHEISLRFPKHALSVTGGLIALQFVTLLLLKKYSDLFNSPH